MTNLDGAGGFFPRVCLCETRLMGSIVCHVPTPPRLMRPTSPAPFGAIGRCETTHRRAADDDALQDLCLRDMNSVAAVGKRERDQHCRCLEVSCRWRNGSLAASAPISRPFRWARVAVARRPETLSVGRRVPLPANPARPTRKCRSQRLPRTSPKCASVVLTSSAVLLLLFNAVGVRVEREGRTK